MDSCCLGGQAGSSRVIWRLEGQMNFPPVHPARNLEAVRAVSGFHMAPPAPCSTSVLRPITVAAPASTCSHSQSVFIFRVYGLRLTCDCVRKKSKGALEVGMRRRCHVWWTITYCNPRGQFNSVSLAHLAESGALKVIAGASLWAMKWRTTPFVHAIQTSLWGLMTSSWLLS